MREDGTIVSVTAYLDTAVVSGNTYVVEIFHTPSSPTVLATLTLSGGENNDVNTFSVSVLTTQEIGARIRRTVGSGASAFSDINVILEVSIP